jgi:beta-glucosidase
MRAVLALVALLSAVLSNASPPRGRHVSKLRQEPQADFIWGAATASYQIEGSPRADGKQPSVWDDYSKKSRHKIKRDHNGDNADEDYIYFFNKTIPMIKDLGAKYYRMSIAWTRILKEQTAENPAGIEIEAGIKHYRDIFAALKAEGIKPVLTMWHWDTPLSLEKNYKGFLNREQMPIFFENYARTLLNHYGDDVQHWVTLNEPLTVAQQGYSGAGIHAPGRCSDRTKCLKGDSQKEPYLAGHTMLLAHAHAVKVIREHAKGDQMMYGIALNGDYCLPHDPHSSVDKEAAERCMEF